ncbi:MAG: hypothetical protein AAB152_09135 [Candidatus Coatesbacteria bacterium]
MNVPRTMRAVTLHGTGFQSLKVSEVPVPEPGDRQILCRVDAFTVCPSLLKLVSQGPAHAFLDGWDLARWPVVIGDEGAVTVVKSDRALAGKYREGQRFAIQPAVDHEPVNFRDRYQHPERLKKLAVGYTLGGSFGQYLLVLEEVIEAGCLVELPSQDLGAYEVSLSEPLSCVVSSQDHHLHFDRDPATSERTPRKGLLKGGIVAVFGAGVMARFHIELALTYGPRAVVVFARSAKRFDWLERHVRARAKAAGVALHCEIADLGKLGPTLERLTGRSWADDVIETTASPEVVKAAAASIMGRGSVLNTFGGLAIGQSEVPLDLRKVHYDESIVTGSSGGNPFDTKRTLDYIHTGAFDVGKQIRVVGDLDRAIDFLGRVRDKAIDGKALVYPHTKLDGPMETPDGWTREKEREHLAKWEAR